MIAKLNVSCCMKREGCEWVGHRRHFKDHLESCSHREVQCAFCEMIVKEKDLKNHHIFYVTCIRPLAIYCVVGWELEIACNSTNPTVIIEWLHVIIVSSNLNPKSCKII
jgi:hypothetical protein